MTTLETSRIFLCNADTTRVDEKVVEEMLPYFTEKFGVASTDYGHSFGVEAGLALDKAREAIANAIGAEAKEIIFTSGGTEANNLAIKGIALSKHNLRKGNHIISSEIEHSSVRESISSLEQQGIEVTLLKVNKEGVIDLQALRDAFTDKTILVTIQHANGEIGAIQPIEQIGKICQEKGVPFHTDAVQSFTKTPIDVKKMGVDLMSLSSHLIHGPKGVGALYMRRGVRIKKLLDGGYYERNTRGGTENVSGIVGFGKAVELSEESQKNCMQELRDLLIDRMLSEIPHTQLTGPPKGENRLCNNASFIFNFVEGESLLLHLDMRGISVSTGSACSTKRLKASHVLTAIGLPQEISHGSLRVVVSRYNTEKEINHVADILKEVVSKLRSFSPMNEEFLREWMEEEETRDKHFHNH